MAKPLILSDVQIEELRVLEVRYPIAGLHDRKPIVPVIAQVIPSGKFLNGRIPALVREITHDGHNLEL